MCNSSPPAPAPAPPPPPPPPPPAKAPVAPVIDAADAGARQTSATKAAQRRGTGVFRNDLMIPTGAAGAGGAGLNIPA